MTLPQIAILALLGVALLLFVSEWLRHDLVAILALVAAVLLGLVPAENAFAGFGNAAVITVACVLVMGHAVHESGAVDLAGRFLAGIGRRPWLLLSGMCLLGAALSAWMNNIGALALVMPLAMVAARRNDLPPSRLLMPLSFATLLGGTITLIGTPPNILVADLAGRLNGEKFGMFDFAPVGLAITLAGVAFMALFGWRLLPHRRGQSTIPTFDVGLYVTEVALPPQSRFVGHTLEQLEEAVSGKVAALGLIHGERRLPVHAGYRLQAGDVLLLQAETEALSELVKSGAVGLVAARSKAEATAQDEKASGPAAGTAVPAPTDKRAGGHDLHTIEAVVTANSRMRGRTARRLRLRSHHDMNLLAISRRGRPIVSRVRDVPLEAGDVLLLEAPMLDLHETLGELGCLPLADRNLRLSTRRVVLPLMVFAGAVLLVALEATSAALGFTIGAVLMVLFGLIRLRDVYTAIDWSVIVLLAALIPVAQALETTGTAKLIGEALGGMSGSLPPRAVLALVMALTMLVTPMLNNAATVLIMGPIAHQIAHGIGVESPAFLMAVAIGASCDFLTPFGHQNNTLVMGPGGYRFADFWRMGLPLDALVLAVSVALLPLVFPLAPLGSAS